MPVQVVTLGIAESHLSLSMEGKAQIDPQFLHQRLINVVPSLVKPESAFKQNLCSYPSALFDSSPLLQEADKPALADASWKFCETDVPSTMPLDGIQYVLDGGVLLQCIP